MAKTLVEVLVISNKYDFSTEYVVNELRKRNVNYLRINIESLSNYDITFFLDPRPLLKICIQKQEFIIKDGVLQGVYFRAPVFYRASPPSLLGQIKEQWGAFYRSLLVFDSINWINKPTATYKAEHKVHQILQAQKLGFLVPRTIVSNSKEAIENSFKSHENIVVKSIDTFMFNDAETESFSYSSIVKKDFLEEVEQIPAFYQEYLDNKVDYRITVVGSKVYSVKILEGNSKIYGDWRLKKEKVNFVTTSLPKKIKKLCINLVKELNLTYGAIDLVFRNNDFYFLEINPTGEWGWLIESNKFDIYASIADCLVKD